MSGLDSLYQDIILDASRRRSGEGEIAPFDAEHFEKNPSCGDEIRLRVRVEDDRVAEIGWVGDGCSISMASASIMVEQLVGQPVAQARAGVEALRGMLRKRGSNHLTDDEADLLGDAIAFEGVGKYVMRVKCAMLGWVALEAAMREAEAA
ncbi:Fe-S cluster assembly sulfur transfer protein SufU [Gulosibacter sediminis]|uniref:Fe-S cluster assembly sulfur transfer protein SufU n=1 Tax=Gulosibacter sediminis TaxID=1729695 RepID=UPI00186968D1|nr:SUF system NifU family Fe-S cluster assembly protein [Gulosibacter sediminis]